MKIGVQTWGSDGDINPLVALAGGLAAAGHEVTLAVTSAERKDYGHYAQRLGFDLNHVGYIAKDDDHLVRVAARLLAAPHLMAQMRILYDEMFLPCVDTMYDAARSLAAGNDLLIGHFVCHPIQIAAERAGKPYATVTLNHGGIATRYAPSPMFPNLGGWLNRLTWKLSERIVNSIALPAINRLRREEGLLPVPSYRDVWESPTCNLIAVSPELCPPRPDWGQNQRVCGFLRIPEEAGPWQMPEPLGRFLAEGLPPVYMTFGSMLAVTRDPALVTGTTELLVAAAKAARCRAIIQSYWDIAFSIPDDEAIYRITSVPHTAIFPHCVAVVHHGGAGTTQTATLCGCPSVVVAHIADQFFWGDELRRVGVAPRGLRRRTVTAAKLGQEIRHVLETPAMGERARRLGERLRAENGVQRAIDILERTYDL